MSINTPGEALVSASVNYLEMDKLALENAFAEPGN